MVQVLMHLITLLGLLVFLVTMVAPIARLIVMMWTVTHTCIMEVGDTMTIPERNLSLGRYLIIGMILHSPMV